MGDVMSKIILHLLKRALAEHCPDEIPKHEDKNEEGGSRTGEDACHLPQHAFAERFYVQTIKTIVGRVVFIVEDKRLG